MNFSLRDEEFGKVASNSIERAHWKYGYTIVRVKTVRAGVQYREAVLFSGRGFKILSLGTIEPVEPNDPLRLKVLGNHSLHPKVAGLSQFEILQCWTEATLEPGPSANLKDLHPRLGV